MDQRYNLAEIEEGYRYFYQEALKNGENSLPYYSIHPWDQTLGPTERHVFHDIRSLGLRLYPIFPVAPGTFLHFADPFQRLGVEIAFKDTPKNLLARKQQLLKAQRWTLYVIDSQHCKLTIEEFFRTKRTSETVEFEDLSRVHQLRFFEKFRLENSTCLLEYIKYAHFERACV
jgi:hypothetical protein